MKTLRRIPGVLALAVVSASAFGADVHGPANVEDLRYSWRIKGGIRFIAGLMFPTSGTGSFKTTYPKAGEAINSELLITSPAGKSGGFYLYESQMDAAGDKTLMTYTGYEWGKKARNERTHFDYTKGLARINRQNPEESAYRVKKLPQAEMRDILTAIYYLRQHASEIRKPVATSIYTDGKEYPVIFQPAERRAFTLEKAKVTATAFEIIDAPGGKKWSGGVKVWLTDDARRIPVRIEIQQSVAALQLDLQSIASSGFELASN
ncbi:MAG TPA: DUF3108 domain-containing protein [Thermoanaerobaculia bacterium]|nr:DUF3108 domain-containing protein [Thermoanaerobaculia bacterium]